MNDLAGTATLTRFIARRDRIRLAAWVGGITTLVLVTATSTKGLYGTEASLRSAATLAADNPAALALNGPDQALDTIGGQIVFQIGAFGLVCVGLLAVLLTGRVTRAEEDSGRLELVRALPVGRHAPLAAGLLVVVGALVALAGLSTLVLWSQDLPLAGAIVYGASILGFGLVFVGITAVAAQVAENPRVTSGAAGAALGLAFALRAIGDATDAGPLAWASPMGWAQRSRPFASERWWPLALLLATGVALLFVARALLDRRDFGVGMVAPKPGPPRAAAWLASPFGLALRLHRAAVAWWVVAVMSLGLVYGLLASSIDEFVADNEALEDLVAGFGDGGLTDAYLSTSLVIVALLAAGTGLQVALRLRTEETGGRAEPVLATATSRTAWMGGHLAAAFGGGAAAVVAGGLGLGVSYAATGGGWDEPLRLGLASLAHVPAVWVLTALAAALFGVVPRWTAAAWGALGACFVLAMFGPVLDLPAWVADASPFQHTPAVPADQVTLLPLAALVVVAAGLTAAGIAAFRRRDLAP